MRHILIALCLLLLAAAPARADSAPVEWALGDATYFAGSDITVNRAVNGSLTATGETVALTNNSAVKGNAWIAGRHVAVEGTVGGDLYIRAQDGIINGTVKGNVSFYGASLVFGPDARIAGNVSYFTALPTEIDKGAEIKGSMKSGLFRNDPRDDEAFVIPPSLTPGPDSFSAVRGWSAPGYGLSWGGAVFFGFIAGLIAALWPAEGARLGDTLRQDPFMAFIFGAFIFFGVPVVAVMALFTIIGIPLTLILLLLWPLIVLAGIVAIILAFGAMVDERFTFVDAGLARRLAGIILATVLLRIGISLPILGGLIWLGAVLAGIGALALVGRSRLPA